MLNWKYVAPLEVCFRTQEIAMQRREDPHSPDSGGLEGELGFIFSLSFSLSLCAVRVLTGRKGPLCQADRIDQRPRSHLYVASALGERRAPSAAAALL